MVEKYKIWASRLQGLTTHVDSDSFINNGKEYIKFVEVLLHYFFLTFGSDLSDRTEQVRSMVEEYYTSLYDGFKIIMAHPEWSQSQAAYFLYSSETLNKKKLAWKATVEFIHKGLGKSDVEFIYQSLEKILMEEVNYGDAPDDRRGE